MNIHVLRESNLSDLTEIREHNSYIAATRIDGLRIFLDKFQDNADDKAVLAWLNNIRLSGSELEVVIAVGLARGMQIARSYAQTHAKGLNSEEISESYRQIAKRLVKADLCTATFEPSNLPELV
jgi:hypothetical protein